MSVSRDPDAEPVPGGTGPLSVVHDVALRRRSVRTGFAAQPVPPQVLGLVVSAGAAAPSSKNARPWRLTVVTDRDLLRDVAQAMRRADESDTYVPVDPVTGRPRPEYVSTVPESADVLEEAPCAVVVSNAGDFSAGRSTMVRSDPEALELALVGFGLEMMGIGGAVQNMWLTAVELGLVGVFMGDVMVAEAEVRHLLGLDADLVGALALGYPIGAA